MASAIFDVTPEQIEASASKIESKAAEFTKAYNSIYAAIKDLRVKYKGEASDTFNKKAEAYRKDFTAADAVLKKYVEFLRDYAKRIKSAEADAKAKATALRGGK